MRFVCILLAGIISLTAADVHKTKNVILVTADGLRWQELFSGIDSTLMNEKATGMDKAASLREKLWRSSPEERRRLLMPFFWSELVKQGVVLGNPALNSRVQVSNLFRVSYPGYSEILTGRAQDEAIRGNDRIQNPTPTILEFVRQKLSLPKSQVALFASWDVFEFIGESKPGSIHLNAGNRQVPQSEVSAQSRQLSELQPRMLTPWDSVRHDYLTFELAKDHLRTAHPRLMQISLGEMDDWAHDRRYDRVLQTIGYFDECLKSLWTTLQSMPEYRGVTTMIVTVDHGRGPGLEDWHSHGQKIKGAEQIWLAAIGPDTAALGEMHDTATVLQRDIAPTILDLLNIDYHDYTGVQGHPITFR